MTKARLQAILDEQKVNPAAFEKDGFKYFLEALPLISKHAEDEVVLAPKPKAEIKEPFKPLFRPTRYTNADFNRDEDEDDAVDAKAKKAKKK